MEEAGELGRSMTRNFHAARTCLRLIIKYWVESFIFIDHVRGARNFCPTLSDRTYKVETSLRGSGKINFIYLNETVECRNYFCSVGGIDAFPKTIFLIYAHLIFRV